MDMVEVCDRQLFVTCRLCISDLGVYQISPQVQQQIKYCFDIDVKLFDGLPQLLCKKCKTILEEHYHVKQSFLEKQATLKAKLTNKTVEASYEECNDNNSQEELPCSSAQDEDIKSTRANYHGKQTFLEKPAILKTVENVEASNEVHNENNSRQESPCLSAQDEDKSIKPTRLKRKRCRLCSSTSSENLEAHEVQDTDPFEISKKRYKPSKGSTWKENYKRKLICQVCSKMCKKKNSLTKHLRKHNTLLKNFPTVFSRGCKVKLTKIDNNPNMTGSNDNVVVSPDRILSNCKENKNYCVIYTSKRNRIGRLNSSDGCEYNQDVNGNFSDKDIIGKKDYDRRSRTRSSNETVILNDDYADIREISNRVMSDEDENIHLSDAECINIDDSSESESTKSNKALRDSTDITPVTVRAKLTDHNAMQNVVSECCTNYLQKTECAENEMSKGPDESKLKRIILNMGQKIVSKQGFNCTGLLRFMEYSDLNIKWIQANPKDPKNISKENNYVYIQPKLIDKLNCKVDGWIDIPEQHALPVNHFFETEGSNGHKVYSKNSTYSAVPTGKAQSKLLNKSPVPNPKQLPKKTYTNPSSENTDPEPVFDTEEVNGDNLCMPKITSTKSLAFLATEVQKTVSGIENSSVFYNKDVNESIDALVISNSKNVNESIDNSAVSDSKNVKKCIDNSAVLNNKDVNESIENSAVSNNKYVNESVKISAVSNNKNVKETIANSAGLNNKNVKESIENSTMSNIKNVKESEKNVPRIKVKPDSELMSERVLKDLSQMQQVNTANIWDTPQPSNIKSGAVSNIPIQYVPNGKNTSPVQAFQLVPDQYAGGSAGATSRLTAAEDKDYLMLHTVELPNYRTNSPFKYVQKLLQMYNLDLLESHESVTQDFECLIKLKLQIKQEKKDDHVIIFLSFHCFQNKFYLGVKACNQENNVDLRKLSANWQWEIINQIYRDEVVSEVLKTAQEICQSTHDYAKSFLCLLKSVKKRET